MFGYIASSRFDESKVWDYASLVVFEEIGCRIKTVRGKVFDKDLLKSVKDLKVGQQVSFETKKTIRGNRTYVQFTEIKAATFSSCNKCGRALQNNQCYGCTSKISERFEGDFSIVEATDMECGVKLVLRQREAQFAFIQWCNGPFQDKFSVGDTATVCGWRGENRITQLRSLYKAPLEASSESNSTFYSATSSLEANYTTVAQS